MQNCQSFTWHFLKDPAAFSSVGPNLNLGIVVLKSDIDHMAQLPSDSWWKWNTCILTIGIRCASAQRWKPIQPAVPCSPSLRLLTQVMVLWMKLMKALQSRMFVSYSEWMGILKRKVPALPGTFCEVQIMWYYQTGSPGEICCLHAIQNLLWW